MLSGIKKLKKILEAIKVRNARKILDEPYEYVAGEPYPSERIEALVVVSRANPEIKKNLLEYEKRKLDDTNTLL